MTSSGQQVDVDHRIWSACGGQATLGPSVLEKYLFLPQGLIGQCSNNEELRLFCSRLPCVPCTLVSIQYLADTITDEVYAKIIIRYGPPLDTQAPDASMPPAMLACPTPTASRPVTMAAPTTRAPAASRPVTMAASITRVPTASMPPAMLSSPTPAASRPATMPASLTPAASRPMTMAASEIPSLVAPGPSTMPASITRATTASSPATMPASNTRAPTASRLTILPGFIKVIDTNDLISQECTITAACLGVGVVLPKEQASLQISDIHRRVWTFEHRYNNILESHSLANGWRPFLESKKLSPGDSLVFLKTEAGLTVGIRRTPRSVSNLFNMGEPLSRIGSEALSIEELAEILGKPHCNQASFDRTLKFDYFPSVDSSWFVVPRDGMVEKINYKWHVGMKARKIGMVKDQLREVCLQGTVAKVREAWIKAAWKTLDVNWDHTYGEREAATNMWEIEPVLEETTEERPSKKPCLGQEGSDTALTLFGFKIEPTSGRRA